MKLFIILMVLILMNPIVPDEEDWLAYQLSDSDPVKRAEAAIRIGEMGAAGMEEAVNYIFDLIMILDDYTGLEWVNLVSVSLVSG